MGLFDRFKKKQEEPKVEEQQKQPLILQYSDGTIAEIAFDGTVDVEGKIVHAAHVVYTDKDGSFTSRSLLLEPITYKQDGQWVDGTEQYYRSMANRDGSKEASLAYGALKGFFKRQEITEQKMGSNYIGRVARKENGEYYRYSDENFKKQHTARAMAEKQSELEAKQQREDAFMASLKAQIEDKPVNIKTSHAEHLTPEKSPFQGR